MVISQFDRHLSILVRHLWLNESFSHLMVDRKRDLYALAWWKVFPLFSTTIRHDDEKSSYLYTILKANKTVQNFPPHDRIHTPNDDPRPTMIFSSSFIVIWLPSVIGINSTLQLIFICNFNKHLKDLQFDILELHRFATSSNRKLS